MRCSKHFVLSLAITERPGGSAQQAANARKTWVKQTAKQPSEPDVHLNEMQLHQFEAAIMSQSCQVPVCLSASVAVLPARSEQTW